MSLYRVVTLKKPLTEDTILTVFCVDGAQRF